MNIDSFKSFHPYFNEREAWGDITKLEWSHIHHLYLLRIELIKLNFDFPMIIHGSYAQSGHSNNSYHYHGLATDFHIKTITDLYDQYLLIEKALENLNLHNFVGLGTYPHWETPGFHLDSRGFISRWLNKFNKYFYFKDKNDKSKWVDLYA